MFNEIENKGELLWFSIFLYIVGVLFFIFFNTVLNMFQTRNKYNRVLKKD